MIHDTHSDDQLTIAIFASLSALLMGAIYFVARIGFVNPPLPVISTVGVALFIFCAPIVLGRWLANQWYISYPALMLYTLLIACVLGLLPVSLGLILAVVGFVCFAVTLIRWWRGGSWRRNLAFIAGGAAITTWLAALVWNGEYHSPVYLEGLALSSYPPDALYLTGIVKLIQTHGFSTVGLHGAMLHRYHIGSHIMFAMLGNLLGLKALTFYQLGYPVIFVPFFLSAQLIAASAIRRFYGSVQRPLRSAVLLWLVFFAIQVGFRDLHSSYHSESFLVGMALMLITLALGAAAVRHPAVVAGNWQHPSLVTFALIALPLLAFVMSMSKITMIVVLLPVCGYLLLRTGLLRHPVYVLAVALLVGVYLLANRLVTSGLSQVGGFGYPFEHVIYYTADADRPFYFLLTYVLTWVFVITRLTALGISTPRELWDAIWRNQLIDVEIVVMAAVATIVPIAAGLIWGANYFYLIARWIAAVFVLASLPALVAMLRLRDARGITLRGVALAAALILFLPFVADSEVGDPLIKAVRHNHMLRTNYTDLEGSGRLSRFKDALMSGSPSRITQVIGGELIPYLTSHQQYYEQRPEYDLYDALEALGDLPISERRASLLYIPKTNRLFWELPLLCHGRPYLATSLSGLALLQGFPDSTCPYTDDFGYAPYRDVERKDLAASDHAALCAEAASVGFASIYVVDTSTEGEISTEHVECAP